MKQMIIAVTLMCITYQSNAQVKLQQDSAQVRYLTAQKNLGKKFSGEFYPNYTSLHKLSERAFTAKIDSAAKAFYALLNHYKPVLTVTYIAAEQLGIKMYFDKLLVEYPSDHESYTNDRPGSYPIIEREIQDNLTLFNDPALLGNADLMPFIQSFLNYKIDKELKKTVFRGLYNKRLYAMWQLLPVYFKNKPCKSFQQYRVLYDHITRNGTKNTDELYRAFKKECRDTSMTAKLDKVYEDSRNDLKDHQVREYKRIGNYGLDIHIFDHQDSLGKKPVIVFFHGGSWSEGQASWHFSACRKYAAMGWVACSVEYRIYGSQGALPFAAVMDARSAIRWLREHGNELQIDTGRIVASGNSAGGHLALAAALATRWNEKSDHLKYSPVPNVVMANSGVYDLMDEKTAWIRKDLADKNLAKQISPDELVRKNLPPMLLIHSKVDQNVPYPSAQRFVELSRLAGNPVEFKSMNEGGHFIFDHPKYVQQVFAWRKAFLLSLGYPDSDGE
jgi:acetyl esterase/lipase